jgi:hypothetical protein
MAFVGMGYELLCAVHLWSHVLPWGIGRCCRIFGWGNEDAQDKKPPSLVASMSLALVVMLSFPVCLLICRFFSSPSFFVNLPTIVPTTIIDAILYMFPITEMTASYVSIFGSTCIRIVMTFAFTFVLHFLGHHLGIL